jgi:hypothetical protein
MPVCIMCGSQARTRLCLGMVDDGVLGGSKLSIRQAGSCSLPGVVLKCDLVGTCRCN